MNKSAIYFRWSLAIYLLWYYLLMVPNLETYYSAHGMIDRLYLNPRYPSLFFLLPQDTFLWLSFIFIIFLIGMFALGRLSRPLVFVLFLFHLSFHNANPLIIHEPQQLSNLFLILFTFFIPPNDREEIDPIISKILILSLGCYYFVAGVKKLPDPKWLSGEALHQLVGWSGLSRFNFVSAFLEKHSALSKFFTWLSLIFEISAPIGFILKKLRPYWFIFGLLFHVMIGVTLDVGTFSHIMIASYALLLDHKTIVCFKYVIHDKTKDQSPQVSISDNR